MHGKSHARVSNKGARVTTDKKATFQTYSSPNKLAMAGNSGNTKYTTLPGYGSPAGRKGKAKAPGAY